MYPDGLLADHNISHDSPQFKYIVDLHERLWKFVRHFYPGASGELFTYLDLIAEYQYNCTATKTLNEINEVVKNPRKIK